MPEGYAIQAIQAVLSGQRAYCKFLAANDTGLTGGHQAGIYISKPSIPILFDEPGIKGTNKEKWVKVKWQDGIETDTRFIYYGKGTRNEYRITNFGRGFPFLRPEYTGALFVFTKCDAEDYQAFVLNSEEDIDQFLDAFGISPTETNQLIDAGRVQEETQERIAIQEFIAGLTVDFPLSEEMSAAARDIQNRVYDHLEFIRTNPDRMLLKSGEIKDKNIATPKKSGKAVSKIAKPQAPSKSKEDSEPSDPVVKPQPHGNRPNLHIDLQIHISPESTPEQIEAIFASMAKHLYGAGN